MELALHKTHLVKPRPKGYNTVAILLSLPQPWAVGWAWSAPSPLQTSFLILVASAILFLHWSSFGIIFDQLYSLCIIFFFMLSSKSDLRSETIHSLCLEDFICRYYLRDTVGWTHYSKYVLLKSLRKMFVGSVYHHDIHFSGDILISNRWISINVLNLIHLLCIKIFPLTTSVSELNKTLAFQCQQK